MFFLALHGVPWYLTLIGFVGPILLIAIAVKVVDVRDKRRKAEQKSQGSGDESAGGKDV